MNMKEYIDEAEKDLLHTYNRFQIVLDKGEIVEQGTHEELLEKRGTYYRLWEMQQGNFSVREEKEELEETVDVVDENEMSYT